MNLRPDVYAAQLGQDIVLLDARRGEYFCLPDAAGAFELGGSRSARILDPDLAHDAAEMGLMGNGHVAPVRWPPKPVAGLAREPDRPLQPREVVDGLGAFGVVLWRYYRSGFPQLLDHAVRRRRGEATALITPDLIRQVQAFHQILPWAPFQGVCLYRSFFLLAFLRRRGLDATWVFGVQTWPFEAHCWLQVGDVVLDDSLDHVRPFTPILAV